MAVNPSDSQLIVTNSADVHAGVSENGGTLESEFVYVTSVFARGRVWCSEGHVLLGLAREFFLCVLQSQCSVKARVFEHFWLFSIDVVWFHTFE